MKILVLAGGYDQIALIEELNARGHEVILADYLDNPPAKKHVSIHYRISTLDEEAVMSLAQKEGVALVTTACTDQALLTVAKVSERLQLPCYISYETALQVTNKMYMKEILRKFKIPTARFCVLREGDRVDDIENMFGFPIVVKPCDCNSSKGVLKVSDKEQLSRAIEQAFELSRSKSVIVEELLVGEEVSIDIWVDTEGAKVLSVSGTDKIKSAKGSFTIYRSKYPMYLSEKAQNEIDSIAGHIAKVFGIVNSPMLIQAMVNGDKVNVIEFSARMGGGTKYKLIRYMSGVDIMNVYVNRILGDQEQIVVPEKACGFIELDYIYASNGQVDKLVHFDELKREQVIEDYFQYKEIGSLITKATTSSDRIAGVLYTADSKQKLQQKRKRAIQEMDILNDAGDSIMMKEIYEEGE